MAKSIVLKEYNQPEKAENDKNLLTAKGIECSLLKRILPDNTVKLVKLYIPANKLEKAQKLLQLDPGHSYVVPKKNSNAPKKSVSTGAAGKKSSSYMPSLFKVLFSPWLLEKENIYYSNPGYVLFIIFLIALIPNMVLFFLPKDLYSIPETTNYLLAVPAAFLITIGVIILESLILKVSSWVCQGEGTFYEIMISAALSNFCLLPLVIGALMLGLTFPFLPPFWRSVLFLVIRISSVLLAAGWKSAILTNLFMKIHGFSLKKAVTATILVPFFMSVIVLILTVIFVYFSLYWVTMM